MARDTTNGRRVWGRSLPVGGRGNATSVAATGDLLVVSSASGIAGLDRVTGDLVWDGGSFQGNALVREVLAITGSRILVATQAGVRAYGPL